MNNDWTQEEIQIVLTMSEGDLITARDIADELVELGYQERTPAAVRSVRRRNNLWFKDSKKWEKAVKKKKENKKPIKEEPSVIITEQPKILYFDIETTNFKADFGEVLMMGYRWHHEDEYHLLKTNDYEGWEDLNIEDKDYYVLQDIFDVISQADVLVGHYSKRFDHTFIQSRCIKQGLPVIPNPPHIDTWHIARYQLALGRNSMKNIAKFLDCDDQKDSVEKYIWRRVNCYDEEAIDIIAEYCLQDVRTQYAMTQKLMPLATHLPNMNVLTNEEKYRCPGCGGDNIQKRGFHFTKINKFQRYQCQDCGKWCRGRKTLTPKTAERHMY